MAASTTLKGAIYTNIAKIVAGTASAESYPNASTMFGTKVRAQIDTYTADAAYDAGSEISVGLIPKGARVLGFYVAHDAVGAAVTADISVGGTAATGAEEITDMTSAKGQLIPAVHAVSGTVLTADSIVKVITAAATFASGKKLIVVTFFVNED